MTEQHKQEIELKNAYTALANAVSGISELDVQGRYTFVNYDYADFLGYQTHELVGESWKLTVLPKDQDLVITAFKKIEVEGKGEFEVRGKRKNGSVFQKHVLIVAKRNTRSEELDGWYWFMLDISYKKNLTIETGQSFNQFAVSTMDALSAHICVLDQNGIVLNVNESWRKFGLANGLLSKNFAVGINYLEICDQATGECAEEALTMAQGIRSVLEEKQGFFSCVYPCHSPTEKRWFSAKVTCYKGASSIRVVVAHENLTESKLAEEALRQSEQRYRTLVNHAPIGIHEWDADWKLRSVNPAGLEMLGLKRQDEILGMSFREVGDAVERSTIQRALHKASLGQSVAFEYSISIAESLKIFYQKIVPIVPQSGAIQKYMGITQDVTEQKAIEADLHRLIEETRSLSAELSRAQEEERKRIARELHDHFGQVLTSLNFDIAWLNKHMAAQKNLIRGKELAKKLQGMSKVVIDSIQSLRKIATSLRPSILDDLGLVAALEWQVREFQEQSQIVCDLQISPQAASASVEGETATGLYRISQEFLTNVMRHSQATEVKIAFRVESQMLVLEMSDNGIGITKSQINNSRSWGIVGMRERVVGLGGHCSIDGGPGKGTIVKVEVPLRA